LRDFNFCKAESIIIFAQWKQAAVLVNAFFQVKLKLPLSELSIALKVIIDFANHFRSAEYCQVNLSKTN